MFAVWATVLVLVIVLAALSYWSLVLTEGTYLGPRVVTLLYDWTARGYDAVKKVHFVHEARFLEIPMSGALKDVQAPRVLDVATGTGRMPLALLRGSDSYGFVVGIDRSVPMLAQAATTLGAFGERSILMAQDAAALAFGDAAFDAVSCLEALEFMWDPVAVLREMARVLKPGGVLLVSRRVGPDAWFFPGRLCRRGHLERVLGSLGLSNVQCERWQVHYDLLWARK